MADHEVERSPTQNRDMNRITVTSHSSRASILCLTLVILTSAFSGVALGQDTIEFLDGKKIQGVVKEIRSENREFDFEVVVGGKTILQTYPYDKVHAVTMKNQRHVVTPKKAAKNSVGERYAILVGVRKYDKVSGLRPLAYTENDVTKMAELLYQSGYRPENIVLMTDAMGQKNARFLPEREKIWREMRALMRDRNPEDSLLVAFAGHGVEFKGNEDNYFCPLGARVEQRNTLISMKALYKELVDCRAGVKVLLVDACRNDPVTQSARGLDILEEVNRVPLQPPGGIAAFFSCSENEAAYEDANLKHGVFFHFLIEALLGAGDLDNDEAITLPELELYVKRRVPDYVRDQFGGNRQMPNLKGNTRGLVALVELADLETLKPRMFADLRSDSQGKTIVNGIGMTFVKIEGGEGWMGQDARMGYGEAAHASVPLHPIHITKAYNIGMHEVTQQQYEKVMGKNPSFFSASGNGHNLVEGVDTKRFPVEQVSWFDACEFCRRLSALPSEKAAGRVYRLPTEAEWEFAGRGLQQESSLLKQIRRAVSNPRSWRDELPSGPGFLTNAPASPNQGGIPETLRNQLLFHYGSDSSKLDLYGWYNENSDERAHKVGGLKPNLFGIYDMYGNVGEWCADFYGHTYFESHFAGANPSYRHYPDMVESNGLFVFQHPKIFVPGFSSTNIRLASFFNGPRFGLPLQHPILDPIGPSTETVIKRRDKGIYWGDRVTKGGTFTSPFQFLMSDSRGAQFPTDKNKIIGFRVVFDKQIPRVVQEFHHAYNQRRGNPRYLISSKNVKLYRAGSGVWAWAPVESGEWAELTFRYDLPFVISSARLKLRAATVLQKTDPKAQVELLVSADGQRWTTLVVSKGTEAQTYLIEKSDETLDPQIEQTLQDTLKGSQTAFVRIRGISSLGGMKTTALLICNDDDSNAYEFHATGIPDSNLPDETLQQLRRSLDADPDNVSAKIKLGLGLAKEGNLNEAIVQLRAAALISANNKLSHYYLGLALLGNKEMDEAITHLKIAVELQQIENHTRLSHSAEKSLQSALGSTSTPTGKLEEDAVKFRVATGINRLDARAYYELGRALLQKDKSFEAIVYFGEAVRCDVPLSFLQDNLNSAYLQEHLVRLNQLLEEDKDNVFALYKRGVIHYALGEHRVAREDYEHALKLNPEHADALNSLAWLLATSAENDLRDGKQAIKLAVQANELSQYQNPSFQSTLAAAYAETGDYEKALEWSKKAIAWCPRTEIPEQYKAELKSYQQQKPWRE
jgi:formylglycine-generating enzyme required for sulfatase activity/tetratricopeptide (TPR) repeat protein